MNRARQAGAADLADRAADHRNALMERGRQRWQLLVALGEALAEPEAGLEHGGQAGPQAGRGGRAAPAPSAADDLDRAWARFEAEQELEQLQRRQGG